MREEAAVIGDQMEAGGIAVQRLTGAEENGADHEKGDDRQHLNQREPELHFAKHLDGGQVQAQQQQDHRQRGDPVGESGKPELRVGGDGDKVRHPGHYPAEPVGPAGKVARPRPQQIGREVAKGFIFEVRQQ